MPDELLKRGNAYQFAEIQAHFYLQSKSKEDEHRRRVEEADEEREAEHRTARPQGRPGKR